MKNKMIILSGPTAVGKTHISIGLAKRLNGEIISADSMQVYRHMNIGTAKIKPEEMEGVPHHLIDILEPTEEFNVATFASLAKKACNEIWERGRLPIIVGGTAFYIQALLYDVDFKDEPQDFTIRNSLQAAALQDGGLGNYEKLKEIDPDSANSIHPNNIKRVIRALEYFYQTGEKMSVHNETERQKESPYDFKYYALTHKRDVIYDRIEKRIDLMIEEGLVDEVRGLLESGVPLDSVAMKGLGYKEIAEYIMGNCSLSDAVSELKLATRHFAKRQLTWLRHEDDVIWFDKSVLSEEEILATICKDFL